MSDTALILTYHSISRTDGPTSIAPDIFAMQMQELADAGYRSLRLDEFSNWHAGASFDRAVLITFDDAFSDFAEIAAPILAQHAFSAVVFVPTAKVGGHEDWAGADVPARALMGWDMIRALAAKGVEFGGHSLTHANLTKLAEADALHEIAACQAELTAQIGLPISSFAAPYGAVNFKVVELISQHYQLGFGTRLARTQQGCDRHDLPRIDMHYFRNRRHWRALLEGRNGYLRLRQSLRRVREVVTKTVAGGNFG